MVRRQNIQHTVLTHDAIELLSHNKNRIHAVLMPDTLNSFGVVAIGNSGQLSKNAPPISLYYTTLIWYGTNPLWACSPSSGSDEQAITVIELLEE